MKTFNLQQFYIQLRRQLVDISRSLLESEGKIISRRILMFQLKIEILICFNFDK